MYNIATMSNTLIDEMNRATEYMHAYCEGTLHTTIDEGDRPGCNRGSYTNDNQPDMSSYRLTPDNPVVSLSVDQAGNHSNNHGGIIR